MYTTDDLIEWASNVLAHGPELGDGVTSEGSAILSDIRKNRARVSYQGKEHDVPAITFGGNYIISPRVDAMCATILVLKLRDPVLPGTDASEEACKNADPVLSITMPNPNSLQAILAWIAKLSAMIHKAQGPFTASIMVGQNENGETCTLWTQTPKDVPAPSPVSIVPLTTGQSPHDYTEDFDHENGRYFNNCNICGAHFEGHKRRVICRVCNTNGLALLEAIEAGKTVQWANEVGLRSWFDASVEDVATKIRTPAIIWRIKDGA